MRANAVLGGRGVVPALLLLTLALRVGFVLTEDFVIFSDLLAFDQIGQKVAVGDFAQLYKPPLYGIFLGAIYFLWGHSYLVVGLIQAALGTVTGWMLYRYAGVLHGQPADRVALLLFAFYPDLIVYPGLLLSETLFIALLVGSMWLLVTARGSGLVRVGVAGIGIGLATLTRAALEYFTLLVAVLLYRKERQRSSLAAAGVFLMAFVCTLAPWTVHNYVVTGRFIPVYGDAWQAVWIGNNPAADGTYVEVPPRFAGIGVAERNALARREVVTFVLEHPARAAQLAVKKVSIFWSPKPDQAAGEYLAQIVGRRGAYVVLSAAFTATFVLAALGFCFVRDWRGHWLFLVFALYYTGIHAASYVGMRYRLPLVPFLLSYAAYGITVLRTDRSSMAFARARMPWMCFAALVVVFAANAVVFLIERAPTIVEVLW